MTELYVLQNTRGMTVEILTYGGIIRSISVPDRTGSAANVVLGLKTPEAYRGAHPYFGCITGRYANRIAGGKFTLDGVQYTLATNDGPNALHGGLKGSTSAMVGGPRHAHRSLALSYLSADGEERLSRQPRRVGDLHPDGRQRAAIDYMATTDRPTIVNLTNHSYFNLKGEGAGTINDHILMLNADRHTPVDENVIPTGEPGPSRRDAVRLSPAQVIGGRLRANHPQILRGLGYDHNFVLARSSLDDTSLILAAQIHEPTTGASWKFTPPSRASSFTRGTCSTAGWSAPAGASTARATGWRWKRSTSRTHPTSRISARCCGPARRSARRRSTGSRPTPRNAHPNDEAGASGWVCPLVLRRGRLFRPPRWTPAGNAATGPLIRSATRSRRATVHPARSAP